MIVEYEEFYSKKKDRFYRVLDLKSYYNELPEQDKTPLREGNTEIECTCPYCQEIAWKTDKTYKGKSYTKHKLFITLDWSRGWCHRCNTAYLTPKVIEEEIEFKSEVPEITERLYGSLGDYEFNMKSRYWPLDQFNRYGELTHKSLMDLYERNPYLMNHYKELNYRSVGPDIIAIPFYYKSESPIYYQLWRKGMDPKYFNPPITTKPIYICGPIKKKGVIVEGLFDAAAALTLYPDRTPVALIGSYVTPAMEYMIRSLVFRDTLIYLDTTQLSYKAYNQLKKVSPFTTLSVEYSDGEDPEDKLNRLIKIRS